MQYLCSAYRDTRMIEGSSHVQRHFDGRKAYQLLRRFVHRGSGYRDSTARTVAPDRQSHVHVGMRACCWYRFLLQPAHLKPRDTPASKAATVVHVLTHLSIRLLVLRRLVGANCKTHWFSRLESVSMYILKSVGDREDPHNNFSGAHIWPEKQTLSYSFKAQLRRGPPDFVRIT